MKLMKLIYVCCFVFMFTFGFGQSIQDVLYSSDTEITWVGLDFSHARFVGSHGFTNPLQIKDYYFSNWNNLMLQERSKYDLSKTFVKKNVHYHFSVVEKGNQAVNAAEMVTNEPAKKIERKDIEAIIQSYDIQNQQNQSKIGLVFIVESFDKIAEKATVHVTFFNTETKEIILTDVLTGKPQGFGFRNYWAGAIYDILKEIRTKRFKSWQKAYKSK